MPDTVNFTYELTIQKNPVLPGATAGADGTGRQRFRAPALCRPCGASHTGPYKRGDVVYLYQAYVALRYVLRKRAATPHEKWLLLADLLDSLERDFRAVYPDAPSPFPDGYRDSLFHLLGPKRTD